MKNCNSNDDNYGKINEHNSDLNDNNNNNINGTPRPTLVNTRMYGYFNDSATSCSALKPASNGKPMLLCPGQIYIYAVSNDIKIQRISRR